MSKKYKQVKLNLYPEDHALLSELADAAGMSRAQYVLSKLSLKIEDATKPRNKVIYKEVDPRLLYQINRIGNNLNQIAKKLHQGYTLERRLLVKIYEEISKL